MEISIFESSSLKQGEFCCETSQAELNLMCSLVERLKSGEATPEDERTFALLRLGECFRDNFCTSTVYKQLDLIMEMLQKL